MGVLRDREPELSAVQQIAIVDSAARWMDEEAGDELAYALLWAALVELPVSFGQVVDHLQPAPDDVDAARPEARWVTPTSGTTSSIRP